MATMASVGNATTMPYSPVSHDSPATAHQLPHKPDRPTVSTTVQAPLSKRDKKRNALSEKLTELTNSFSQNRDAHYRSQLTGLQVDMQLILRADPYRDAPLADMGEDVDTMVSMAVGGAPSNGLSGSQGASRWTETDAAALAGRWYMQFVDDINNAVEDRDLQLTLLEQKHRQNLEEFENLHKYRVRLAEEEHAILGRTIRDRLVQSITEKKKRLTKEKEQLDVADSNALLLHPNQFSITNPASPGGAHSNRKTRHTRHRAGDIDDSPAVIASVETTGNKRKRKLAVDDDTGSPGPSGRLLESNGHSSPYRDARARLAVSQFETPLYSIDKLFSEKELSLHLHMAATAATHFFALANNPNSSTTAADDPSTNADVPSNTTLPLPAPTNTSTDALPLSLSDAEQPAPPTLIAPEMDRAANTSHHATRSTRALNMLGDLAMSEKQLHSTSSPFALNGNISGGTTTSSAFAPMILPSVITKTGQAPTPPSVSADTAADDITRILSLASTPGIVDERLLAELLGPAPAGGVRAGLPPPPAAQGTTSQQGMLAGGGVPMSAQSSAMGTDAGLGFGGTVMKRDESAMGLGGGAAMMKRTASGAGFASGGVGMTGEAGKRGRNR